MGSRLFSLLGLSFFFFLPRLFIIFFAAALHILYIGTKSIFVVKCKRGSRKAVTEEAGSQSVGPGDPK